MHCLQRSDKDNALELLRYTTSNGRKRAARTASISSTEPHTGDVIENPFIAHRSKTRLVCHRVHVLPSVTHWGYGFTDPTARAFSGAFDV
ncbi:hypothetical protein BSU04_18065 [Caballeronia sordidicola]|uniref:Uncharacterized protein n=1 Tax=Caballeronia sordidicola TaxID=196367 RepID=A0A226X0E9_CABSO|nr:hypothetical protein BSU04_18065 [Caballeronia sordidicola]